jgi:hypothetical protein
MFDPGMIRLMHLHGDTPHPMRPRDPHDLAGLDPEREWAKHGRVWACDCGDVVTVVPDHVEVPGVSR